MTTRMLASAVIASLGVMLACGQPDTSPATVTDPAQASARVPFLGAWSLSQIERRGPDGELTEPPIEDRLGYLLYTPSGHMGVTIMQPGRTPYADGSGPTADEAMALWSTYTSYFGRFTVDETARIVTHHLEGSIDPGGAGSDDRHVFRFGENRLTLQSPAAVDGARTSLTWTRLTDLSRAEHTDTHQQLVGGYRVESVTRTTTDGYDVPADQYEAGYLLYSPSGHMSVHLARPGRLPFAGDQPTPAEAQAAIESYVSYFGPFSVHELAGCITCPGPRDQGYLEHHRVGSADPSDQGSGARRYYELTETHLTLRPPIGIDEEGRQVVTAIRWARLSAVDGS